MNNENKIIN